MKILIAEDDYISQKVLKKLLSEYGECYIAADGKETIELFMKATEAGDPFDLICLDIMMPKMDGHTILQVIRRIEVSKGIFWLDGVKIIITSSFNDDAHVMKALRNQANSYLIKPIDKKNLMEVLNSLKLTEKN